MLEYEDSFPFDGTLSKVRGSFSYKTEEVQKINLLAKTNGLSVIPYISLFDDLDFVLRHADFKKYREMPKYSEMISPLHEAWFNLLRSRLFNKVL